MKSLAFGTVFSGLVHGLTENKYFHEITDFITGGVTQREYQARPWTHRKHVFP